MLSDVIWVIKVDGSFVWTDEVMCVMALDTDTK